MRNRDTPEILSKVELWNSKKEIRNVRTLLVDRQWRHSSRLFDSTSLLDTIPRTSAQKAAQSCPSATPARPTSSEKALRQEVCRDGPAFTRHCPTDRPLPLPPTNQSLLLEKESSTSEVLLHHQQTRCKNHCLKFWQRVYDETKEGCTEEGCRMCHNALDHPSEEWIAQHCGPQFTDHCPNDQCRINENHCQYFWENVFNRKKRGCSHGERCLRCHNENHLPSQDWINLRLRRRRQDRAAHKRTVQPL